MAGRSFFIQHPEDAVRHVGTLAKGLKKVAVAGWIAGAGCTMLALLVSHFIMAPSRLPKPGSQEITGVTLVAWFLALSLLLFSTLYFVAGWGLAGRKPWARNVAGGTFLLKVLLCAWLGRGSLAGMLVFLSIAGCDLYGLWVLLSNETGRLFQSPAPSSEAQSSETSQAPAKPANLVT